MNDQREGACTHRPPIANRGSVSAKGGEGEGPEGGRYSGLHWFTLTVFLGDPCPVIGLVEEVGERVGLDLQWVQMGAKGRISETHRLPSGLRVNEFIGATFAQVEIPGQACECFGDVGLRLLVESIDAMGWRWHATRIDAAFDGVGVTPRAVYGLLEAGQYNSRCRLSPSILGNEEGQTCYTVYPPTKSERCVRVYDRRGETRVEGIWRSEQAKAIGAELLRLPVDQWGRRLLELLRAYVDFVDRAASSQACRCPLLPWWADLVGQVARQGAVLPASDVPDPQGVELVGYYDGWLQRAAKAICEAAAAFGPDWIMDRAKFHGLARVDSDRVRQAKLVRAWAAKHRVAGVQPWPDGTVDSDSGEIPF